MKTLITKTDFLDYSFCRKNLWLKKYKPELFEEFELSDFEKKIIQEGNLADETARGLFPKGVLVKSSGQKAVSDTKNLIDEGQEVLFQATFQYDVFYIRADIIVYDSENDNWELYEVKATNKVKKKEPAGHIRDLAFQKLVIEKAGFKVSKTGVIHLNKKYKRKGTLDIQGLFVFADISDQVEAVEEDVEKKMEQMKEYLSLHEEKGCDCLHKGRSNHCTTFSYSNPMVPEYSIYDLYRIGNSKKKLIQWADEQRFSLAEVKEEVTNERQKYQIDTFLRNKPDIKKGQIAKRIDELQYPVYFFDYEALIMAIPLFDGFTPYEHVPFQYSLHVLEEDGNIEHKEFLITELQSDITKPLVERLAQDAEKKGTFVSWHASYEKTRNNQLALLYPEFKDFLERVNETMFDLEKIFLDNLYTHPDFRGKTSIKNILPVLVPDLSYKSLNIQKGDQASERWEKMILNQVSDQEKKAIIDDLLEYCKMDTFAMVRIFEVLKSL